MIEPLERRRLLANAASTAFASAELFNVSDEPARFVGPVRYEALDRNNSVERWGGSQELGGDSNTAAPFVGPRREAERQTEPESGGWQPGDPLPQQFLFSLASTADVWERRSLGIPLDFQSVALGPSESFSETVSATDSINLTEPGLNGGTATRVMNALSEITSTASSEGFSGEVAVEATTNVFVDATFQPDDDMPPGSHGAASEGDTQATSDIVVWARWKPASGLVSTFSPVVAVDVSGQRSFDSQSDTNGVPPTSTSHRHEFYGSSDGSTGNFSFEEQLRRVFAFWGLHEHEGWLYAPIMEPGGDTTSDFDESELRSLAKVATSTRGNHNSIFWNESAQNALSYTVERLGEEAPTALANNVTMELRVGDAFSLDASPSFDGDDYGTAANGILLYYLYDVTDGDRVLVDSADYRDFRDGQPLTLTGTPTADIGQRTYELVVVDDEFQVGTNVYSVHVCPNPGDFYVRVATFIPANNLTSPSPEGSILDPIPGEPGRLVNGYFAGDDRGFDPHAKSYRSLHEFIVSPSTGNFHSSFIDTGVTTLYHPDSLDSDGRITAEALADTTPGDAHLMHKQAKATTDGLSTGAAVTSPDEIVAFVNGSISNPLVIIDPSIDYNLRISIDSRGNYQVTGFWDGFPALEVYINDQFIRLGPGPSFYPGDGPYGAEPFDLFPIWGDITIESGDAVGTISTGSCQHMRTRGITNEAFAALDHTAQLLLRRPAVEDDNSLFKEVKLREDDLVVMMS